MKKLLIVVFSMVSSLCLFPQPMENSVNYVSILLKNEAYLGIKSIGWRYENNQYVFTLALNGALLFEKLTNKNTFIEWDIFIDIDSNTKTYSWLPAPEYTNDLDVDYLVRIIMTDTGYSSRITNSKKKVNKSFQYRIEENTITYWIGENDLESKDQFFQQHQLEPMLARAIRNH